MAVVALLFGCDGPAAPAEPSLGEVPVVTGSVDLALPLDPYLWGISQEYEIFLDAEGILVGECFERFGVSHPGSGHELNPLVAALRGNRNRYGLIDAASAEARGYNSPYATTPSGDEYDFGPPAPEPPSSQKTLEFIASGNSHPDFSDHPLPLDKAGQPLPPDGCSGEAIRQLADPSEMPDLNLPHQLARDSLDRAEADSRVVSAMARWSGCMATSGYDYASSWEPNNADWPDPATDEEIATAVTDVNCKIETNLVGTWYAVDRAYQQRAIDAHAQELNAIKAYVDTVTRKSAAIVAGRPR